MIAQLVFLLAVVIAIGLGLSVLWSVLSRSINPPAEHVTVPIEDAREHLPR
jgi:hypothetical protein